MNKQETAEAILVMQAWIDGKEIEGHARAHNTKSDWIRLDTCESVTFDFDRYEYRIKPKPREFWVEPDLRHVTAALEPNIEQPNPDWIKVREVL